ncbi:MAG: dihydrodipicolinate synthase family protein [Acidimicrobiia bacterium]|nr:dihydrodipicolinate synthase family protein [Acidimicrobiia bacterium]
MIPLPRYLPALITPFTQRGELDVKAHTRNMRVLAELGISGFLIGGSTGEGPYLEPGERARLVKAGRRRKAHFMVGVAAETTRSALALVAEAEEAGADSLLVMTPTTLARGNEDAMVSFYRSVADKAKVPILLYSVPVVTAYNLSVDSVWRLSRHHNIVGMKDSSGDVVRLQAIVDASPGDFLLYTGSTRSITAAMSIGCYGAITNSGNYAPELVLRTLEATATDPPAARRHQKRLNRLAADVEPHGIPGVKAAARAAGLEPGYPRAPLARLSRGAETSIAKLIS